MYTDHHQCQMPSFYSMFVVYNVIGISLILGNAMKFYQVSFDYFSFRTCVHWADSVCQVDTFHSFQVLDIECSFCMHTVRTGYWAKMQCITNINSHERNFCEVCEKLIFANISHHNSSPCCIAEITTQV